MLDLLARHSRIDITVKAKGDLHIDHHHTTEDVGIALGQAMKKALGDMRGIRRYADVHLPMDEALTRVAIDISGRPFLVFKAEFTRDKIGAFDTELVREWFQAFAMNAGVTLHVETLYGTNDHHIAESCFKGLARALRAAVAIDPRAKDEVPSTKGSSADLQASESRSHGGLFRFTRPRLKAGASLTYRSRAARLRFRARRQFHFWAFVALRPDLDAVLGGCGWRCSAYVVLVAALGVLLAIFLRHARRSRPRDSSAFCVALLVGFEAGDLRRWTLERRG